VNIKYGNEAEMAWSYSHAVILIDVPKRGEREEALIKMKGLGEYRTRT